MMKLACIFLSYALSTTSFADTLAKESKYNSNETNIYTSLFQPASKAATFKIGTNQIIDIKNLDEIVPVDFTKNCKVNEKVTRARLTHDRRAILVTSDGYIPIESIRKCGDTPLKVIKIRQDEGILEDVNLEHGIYLALLPISVQPITYLAIIGRLNSKNIETRLQGSYRKKMSDKEQEHQSFTYADDVGPFPIISLDGRYLAPSGQIDCGVNSYPGVWDLKNRTKVSLPGSREDLELACQDLFE